MKWSSKALQDLIGEFERLPGIGRKTAERLAYHVLRTPADEALRLAHAIRDVKKNVQHCRECFSLAEDSLCEICRDDTRDPAVICVVEQPRDVLVIEEAGTFCGRYHVLLGTFAPLDGVEPADLTIEPLLERLRRRDDVVEVILATNPTFEGEGTALLLGEKLREFPRLRVTRIARGIPSGSSLEHASKTIVSDALEGRRELDG